MTPLITAAISVFASVRIWQGFLFISSSIFFFSDKAQEIDEAIASASRLTTEAALHMFSLKAQLRLVGAQL